MMSAITPIVEAALSGMNAFIAVMILFSVFLLLIIIQFAITVVRKIRQKTTRSSETYHALFHPMEHVAGTKRYATENAQLLACSVKQKEPRDRSEEYLFKGKNGAYFFQYHYLHYEEGILIENIVPLKKEDAINRYNSMVDQRISFKEAFGEDLVDA